MSGRFSPSEVYTFLSVQAVVSTIAVALRFWARRIKRATFWWDDWLALLTVILFWGFVGIAIEATRQDFGEEPNPRQGPYDETELHNKLMVTDLALTAVTVTTARLSIIFLYYRIFSVSTQMTLCLWVIGMASTGWMIGSLMILPLNCQPVQALFDPTVTGKCLDSQKQIMAAEIINSVLDTVLVLLPIPLIKKLHLPMREKVAIGTVFLLGGLVSVTSILVIVYTYKPDLPEYDTMGSLLWISLQLCLSIVCCCLPILRPFLTMITHQVKVILPITYWYKFLSSGKRLQSDPNPSTNEGARGIELGDIPETEQSNTELWNGEHSIVEAIEHGHSTLSFDISVQKDSEHGII